MKTAEQDFLDLGFEKVSDLPMLRYRCYSMDAVKNKDDLEFDEILFNNNNRFWTAASISFGNMYHFMISIELNDTIQKQMRELGWLDF